MLLRKTINLDDVQLKMDGDVGKFAGYASVFGGVDSYGDTIVRGAFAHTLKTNGKPKMFLEHAAFSPFASGANGLPIGKYTAVKEDDHGLYVEGELTLDMSLAKDVHAAMRHGTLDGLSIGGMVKKGDYDETESGRVIRRWSSLMEISPVAFPADRAARIESVKNNGMAEAIAEIESIRDFERLLRDVSGLSKGDAVALVSRVKALIVGEGEPQADTAEAKAMQSFSERLARLAA